MLSLEIGESVVVPIKASEYWNHTNIHLEVAATYALEVKGEQFWYDSWIKVDADGYTSQWLSWAEWLRRRTNEKWFALIGNISQVATHTFLIGNKLENYKATCSGELLCYANDVPFMYCNNHGSLTLTITRLN